MICSKCEATVSEDDKFCSKCGNSIEKEINSSSEGAHEKEPRPKFGGIYRWQQIENTKKGREITYWWYRFFEDGWLAVMVSVDDNPEVYFGGAQRRKTNQEIDDLGKWMMVDGLLFVTVLTRQRGFLEKWFGKESETSTRQFEVKGDTIEEYTKRLEKSIYQFVEIN